MHLFRRHTCVTLTQGQIIYLLVNASPKLLDIATSNFAGAYRSHDVDGTGQCFV